MTHPYQVKKVASATFSISVTTFGEGEIPFVILPGISMFPISDDPAPVAAAYADFRQKYRIHLFDRKDGMEEGYGVFDMAEDTAQAMRMLGIRDACVFGASQGGMIALALAIRHPELVAKLAVGSTYAAPNGVANETFRTWSALARGGDARALNRDMFARIYSEKYRETYREAFAALEERGDEAALRRVAILSDACLNFDVSAELTKIRCPLLVLGAKDDRVLSREGSEKIAEATGAKLFLYGDYGHACFDEAPDFRDRLAAFF